MRHRGERSEGKWDEQGVYVPETSCEWEAKGDSLDRGRWFNSHFKLLVFFWIVKYNSKCREKAAKSPH